MQTSKLTTILENEHKKQDTPYGLFSPIWNNNRYFKMDYMYSRYKWKHEFHSFFTSILVDNHTVIICNLGYCFLQNNLESNFNHHFIMF